ncbi:hypothetical protein OG21DRAFT_1603416 [Imleria badia]|nr:hypothetical protein OG21DRAFT_1603416 [Imleria badia]
MTCSVRSGDLWCVPAALTPLQSTYTLRLVQASSTNTTVDETPCDASASHRSIATMLTSCGLTLLVCVWHAVHPDLLPPRHKWYQNLLYRALLVIIAFIIPEFVVQRAYVEWRQANSIANRFREKGYEWTMTHSYFTLMGGFVLRDHERTKELGADDILKCFENKVIANPVVSVEDIMDKSSSDELAKLILLIQLFWFILQIIVRGANHLAITLVEIDTLCLAVITLPIFFFWWGKPRCAARPYVFYALSAMPFNDPTLYNPRKGNWIPTLSGLGICPAESKGETNSLMSDHNDCHHIDSDRTWRDLLYLPKTLVPDNSDIGTKDTAPLFIAWTVFGAMHKIASNDVFPSPAERTLWSIMSVSLATASGKILSLCDTYVCRQTDKGCSCSARVLQSLAFNIFFIGLAARVSLVVLMVMSLRDLPASAHETIPWIACIPHL